MKNGIPSKLILCIITVFLISISFTYAQETKTVTLSKDELKLQKLEEKVARAKDKIEKTEAKFAEADSLMQAGNELIIEGERELDVIAAEEKQYVNEKSTEYKNLEKSLKKADDDEKKSIEAELKVMAASNTTEMKAFANRAKIELKKLEKGKANIEKAKDKEKQLKPILKGNTKSLELAEKELAKFKEEKEL